jgi:hypothetical protein
MKKRIQLEDSKVVDEDVTALSYQDWIRGFPGDTCDSISQEISAHEFSQSLRQRKRQREEDPK